MFDNRQQVCTMACMVIATALILGLDIYTFRTHGVNTTISVVCRIIFDQHPVAAALFLLWIGILIGHLFPPR